MLLPRLRQRLNADRLMVAASLTFALTMLALAFVRATGTDVGPALAQLIAQLPGLPQLVALSYRLTPIAFLAVALLVALCGGGVAWLVSLGG